MNKLPIEKLSSIKINGNRYRVRFFKRLLKDNKGFIDGTCDDPKSNNRTIRLSRSLIEEKNLEDMLNVLIHELLHASNWNLSEKYVTNTAEDLANILIRAGVKMDGFE